MAPRSDSGSSTSPAHDLGPLADPRPQELRPAGQAADALAARLQLLDQAAADVAGGAGDEAEPGAQRPAFLGSPAAGNHGKKALVRSA